MLMLQLLREKALLLERMHALTQKMGAFTQSLQGNPNPQKLLDLMEARNALMDDVDRIDALIASAPKEPDSPQIASAYARIEEALANMLKQEEKNREAIAAQSQRVAVQLRNTRQSLRTLKGYDDRAAYAPPGTTLDAKN